MHITRSFVLVGFCSFFSRQSFQSAASVPKPKHRVIFEWLAISPLLLPSLADLPQHDASTECNQGGISLRLPHANDAEQVLGVGEFIIAVIRPLRFRSGPQDKFWLLHSTSSAKAAAALEDPVSTESVMCSTNDRHLSSRGRSSSGTNDRGH